MPLTTVVYHSADYDGIFCREIARKFLPDAKLIGWNYGDAPLEIPSTALYVLDLPLDAPFGFDYRKVGNEHGPQHPAGIVWIDHHKSNIETHPKDIPGYRIDGVAACRLAWQWFTNSTGDSRDLPCKLDYTDRAVEEPLAVRLAGEYDVWDKRDPDAETFQYGLRTQDLTSADWDDLLQIKVHSIVSSLLDAGEAAQRYAQKIDADLVKHRSYRLKWEGLDFLVLNTGRFNSLTFAALDVPETGHDALMGYMFNGKCWTVSLYHARHRTDLDLSQIAIRHGGGGHKGACGFTCGKLPFDSAE